MDHASCDLWSLSRFPNAAGKATNAAGPAGEQVAVSHVDPRHSLNLSSEVAPSASRSGLSKEVPFGAETAIHPAGPLHEHGNV